LASFPSPLFPPRPQPHFSRNRSCSLCYSFLFRYFLDGLPAPQQWRLNSCFKTVSRACRDSGNCFSVVKLTYWYKKTEDRIWRILTMVYDTQNYWVSGLRPSSGILNTRKHNVSETGSVSILRWGEGDTYSVGSHKSWSGPVIEEGVSLP
jgi:hypothetical protein